MNKRGIPQWLILAVIGILMIVGRQLFKDILYVVFAIGLMLTALSGIIAWWKVKSKAPEALSHLLGNCLFLVAGLWILLNPGRFDSLINILVGAMLIIYGVQWLIGGIRLGHDVLIMVLAGITILAGVVIAMTNAATSWLVIAEGISLIYTAIVGLLTEKRFA
ncbi:MAG: hypothetical protein IJ083_00675 [Clostridia bacterium]|nr:hypothetical protein [Clostridia bacterium]